MSNTPTPFPFIDKVQEGLRVRYEQLGLTPPQYPVAASAGSHVPERGALALFARLEKFNGERVAHVLNNVGPSIDVPSASMDGDPSEVFASFYTVAGRNQALLAVRHQLEQLDFVANAVLKGEEPNAQMLRSAVAEIDAAHDAAISNPPAAPDTLPEDLGRVRSEALMAGKSHMFAELQVMANAGVAALDSGDPQALAAWAGACRLPRATQNQLSDKMAGTGDAPHAWWVNRLARRTLEATIVNLYNQNSAAFAPVLTLLPSGRFIRGGQAATALVEEAMVARQLLHITDQRSPLGESPFLPIPEDAVVVDLHGGEPRSAQQVLVVPHGTSPEYARAWQAKQVLLDDLAETLPAVEQTRTLSNLLPQPGAEQYIG